LSQADLAERSGVSEPTISDLEAGKREHPRPSTLRKLARGLGVEVADFFPEEPALPKAAAPSPDNPVGRRAPVNISAASGDASGSRAGILAGLDEHFDAIVAPLRAADLGEDEAAELVSQEVRRRVGAR